ncbi:hypothetical protein B0H13DRAFT_2453881 [Mycena leptocephala]|nr:hypothetical protein B0H13DRAFT_2453881 [Mycena leptocephala]
MSVKEIQARIAKLSTDIDLQKEVLRQLEQSKSAAQRELNAIRDPVARLPLEISSEIFLLCLPLQPMPGADDAPMLLLNICNAWTDIALSTPALWAAIHINFPHGEGFKEVITIWLQRARNRPLTISLDGEFDQSVAPFIWQHAQQLKHLEILCYRYGGDSDEGSDGGFDLLEGTSPGPLSVLETLIVDGEYPGEVLELLQLAPKLVECTFLDRVHSDFEQVDKMLILPTLRRMMFGKVTKCPSGDDNILNGLSLPALEMLSLPLHEVTVDDFFSFLDRSSPPLQELLIDGRIFGLDFIRLAECLHLIPTLTRFELWRPRSRSVASIFTALADSLYLLPNLQSLTIHMGAQQVNEFHSDGLWQTILRALSARRTQLRVLHVNLADILAAFAELVQDGMQIHIGSQKWCREGKCNPIFSGFRVIFVHHKQQWP